MKFALVNFSMGPNSIKLTIKVVDRTSPMQLNSDVFTGIVTVGRKQMIKEYRKSKKVPGGRSINLYTFAHKAVLLLAC